MPPKATSRAVSDVDHDIRTVILESESANLPLEPGPVGVSAWASRKRSDGRESSKHRRQHLQVPSNSAGCAQAIWVKPCSGPHLDPCMPPTNAYCEHRSPAQRDLLYGFSAEVGGPVVHQDTVALEQVRAGIGRLDHLPGIIRPQKSLWQSLDRVPRRRGDEPMDRGILHPPVYCYL